MGVQVFLRIIILLITLVEKNFKAHPPLLPYLRKHFFNKLIRLNNQ